MSSKRMGDPYNEWKSIRIRRVVYEELLRFTAESRQDWMDAGAPITHVSMGNAILGLIARWRAEQREKTSGVNE